MKFILSYSNNPPFVPSDHEVRGLGGTENFAVYLAKTLVKHGHEVNFYNQAEIEPTDFDGVKWANISHFDPNEEADVLISFRMREVFQEPLAAKLKVIILADTESIGLGNDVRAGSIDVVMPVSKWQMDKIAKEEGLEGHSCWMLASNGVNMQEFNGMSESPKIAGKCIFLSTPERGLDLLLDLWPNIESSEILNLRGVKPELHLFSSFMGWGLDFKTNEIMCADLYGRIESLKNEGHAIHNYKHVAREEIRQHQTNTDVFLYPSNFNETYCISLTECMAAGAIPVVSNRAAQARVKNGSDGYLVGEFNGDSYSEENRASFVTKAIMALALSGNTKRLIREAAAASAREHDYDALVSKWVEQWSARLWV